MVKSQKNKLNPHLISLAIACFLFFLPFFVKPQILTLKDNDLGRNYIPMFTYINSQFAKTKSIPLYRFDQFMGESLIANPLPAYFYPLTFIFTFGNTHFLSVLFYFIHFVLAALATYYLAKAFELSNLSSTSAALFYIFSTKILLHTSAGHITMVASFAYFPLGFLLLKRLLEKKELKYAFYLAISNWAILILYPTIFYYSAIFYIAFTLYFILNKTQNFKNIVKIFTLGVVSALVSFGLSAINLLPQLEFSKISNRGDISLADVAQPIWNKEIFLQSLIFPYKILDNLDHEEFLHFGVIILTLSVLAFARLKTSQKIFLSISVIFTIIFVLGLSTPFFALLYDKLPFLAYSRVTTRLWFAVALIAALLAASYLDKIKNKKIVYFLVLLFLAETIFIGYKKIFQIPNLSTQNIGVYAFISGENKHYRIYCTTYCSNPQLLQAFGIELANGESPIVSLQTVKFLEHAGSYNHDNFAVIYPPYQVWQQENPPQPTSELLGDANVMFVVSPYRLESQRFQLINTIGQNYIYNNLDFRERFRFAQSHQQVKVEKYNPNSISLSFTKSAQERKLIIANSYLPGWFAFQNNKLYKIDQEEAFQSITILPNAGSIELVYKPQSYVVGKGITVATILFLICFTIYIHIRRRLL